MSTNDALTKVSVLMSYLQYENTMYWGRASFFLVAHTVLFGGFASVLFGSGSDSHAARLIMAASVSIFGLLLSLIWQRALKGGEHWIEHWTSVIKQVEPEAFGDMAVLRDFGPRPSGYVSLKKLAHHTMWLFTLVWFIALAYASYALMHDKGWF